jgi:hypothetical protein
MEAARKLTLDGAEWFEFYRDTLRGHARSAWDLVSEEVVEADRENTFRDTFTSFVASLVDETAYRTLLDYLHSTTKPRSMLVMELSRFAQILCLYANDLPAESGETPVAITEEERKTIFYNMMPGRKVEDKFYKEQFESFGFESNSNDDLFQQFVWLGEQGTSEVTIMVSKVVEKILLMLVLITTGTTGKAVQMEAVISMAIRAMQIVDIMIKIPEVKVTTMDTEAAKVVEVAKVVVDVEDEAEVLIIILLDINQMIYALCMVGPSGVNALSILVMGMITSKPRNGNNNNGKCPLTEDLFSAWRWATMQENLPLTQLFHVM